MYRAYTLIELLITIAIITILASTTYPNYRASIRKTYRDIAKLTLAKSANALESYYANHDSYRGAENSTSFTTVDKHYRYSIAEATDEHYLITATPHKDDDPCGVLGINDLGIKSASGTMKLSSCW